MKITVSEQELININFYLNSEQTLLSLLKEKGAPVKGTLHFEPDFENYSWKSYKDHITGDLVFVIENP